MFDIVKFRYLKKSLKKNAENVATGINCDRMLLIERREKEKNNNKKH